MNLSLDKKSLGCTVLSLVLIGGLLFLAGFLLATRLSQSESTTESSAAARGRQRFNAPRAIRPRFQAPRPPSATPIRQAQSAANRATAGPRAGEAPAAPGGDPASNAAASPSTASPGEPPSDPVVYSVQVGAFLRESEVEPVLRDLEHDGFMPFVVKDPDGGLLSVRIGRFETREEAEQLAEEFKSETGRIAVVRPPRQH